MQTKLLPDHKLKHLHILPSLAPPNDPKMRQSKPRYRLDTTATQTLANISFLLSDIVGQWTTTRLTNNGSVGFPGLTCPLGCHLGCHIAVTHREASESRTTHVPRSGRELLEARTKRRLQPRRDTPGLMQRYKSKARRLNLSGS